MVSQPHISPRLRCFNRKITQKLCATCITRHLFWLVISPSCCSRQGPPLWNWGNFDHFNPLQTTLNVIWLKKVVPNLPFTYLGKVKKNWQLFPLLFFGESQKYERGGVCRPPPASNRVKWFVAIIAFEILLLSVTYFVAFQITRWSRAEGALVTVEWLFSFVFSKRARLSRFFLNYSICEEWV